MSEEDYQTPYRQGQDKEQFSTELKRDVESRLKGQDGGEQQEGEEEYRGEQAQNYNEHLDRIESQIKDLQKRLKQIKEQKRGLAEDSQEFLNLEDERRALRKDLVDLDYRHRQFFLKLKRQNQDAEKQKWAEEQTKIVEIHKQVEEKREEQRLERSRRLKQQIEQIELSSKKRREEIEKLYKKESPSKRVNNLEQNPAQSQIKQDEASKEPQQPQKPQAQQRSLDDQAADARYKARIADIQLELASERLRRSRQIELEAELANIRTLTPYYWWRSYRDPLYSYGYPYSRYIYPLYPYRPLYALGYPYL